MGVADLTLKDIFDDLFEVLAERKKQSKDKSYVANLYAQGIKQINSKIKEESEEVIEAALDNDKKHITHEVCDLLFHTFVLCQYKEIDISDIRQELKRRFGTSGIKEKKSRPQKNPL